MCSGRVGTFDAKLVWIVDRFASSLDCSNLFGRRRRVIHRRARLPWEPFGLPLPYLVDRGRVNDCCILDGYCALFAVVSHGLSVPNRPRRYSARPDFFGRNRELGQRVCGSRRQCWRP